MKSSIMAFSMLLLAVAIMAVAGCSSDDAAINPTIVGDTTNTQFQAVESWFSGTNTDDAYGVSSDISFDLLDAQFPSFGSPQRPVNQPMVLGGDSTIIVITNYSYANGWHIFSFSAVEFSLISTAVDTFIIFSGTDSIRVTKAGMDMMTPDSTADGLNIRAHFSASLPGEGFSFSGDHSLDITINRNSIPETMMLNGTLSQNLAATISDSIGADPNGTCDLTMAFSQIITGLTAPLDSLGEPVDCPTSGAISTSATLNLTCTASTGTGLDSLSVNGSWTVNAAIIDSSTIRLTYTDGTTLWTVTESCPSNAPLAAPGQISEAARSLAAAMR